MQHRREDILRFVAGRPPERAIDDLAAEEPLEVRVNRRAVSVTMRTPGHDRELAVGFLLSEGLLRARADVLAVEPCAGSPGGNVIAVHVPPAVEARAEPVTRRIYLSSSCGLCGKASIDTVRQQFPPLDPGAETGAFDAAALLGLPDVLRAAQPTFARTGGLHAAGLFDAAGGLVCLREDVGRHNAVDKVLGHAFLAGRLPLAGHVLLVSGRASFELVQKALSAGASVLAAVSAPSSLAVEFARESGQTLVGFLRDGRMNVYAHPQRLRFPGQEAAAT